MKARWLVSLAAGVLTVFTGSPAAAEGGFYGEAQNYPASQMPWGSGFASSSVGAGDLTGDGIADLAVADFTTAVSVLPGDGHGGFGSPVSYETGLGSTAVTIGDLNADGAADLAVANEGAGTVSVLLREGETLVKAADYQVGFSVLDIAATDVDGNGSADLLAAVPMTQQIVVLRNAGDGRFEQSAVAVGSSMAGVAPADVNSDGAVDLVVAIDGDWGGFPAGVARVQVLLGKGDGTFTVGKSVGGLGFLEGIAVGDVNGDGHIDALGADAWAGAVDVLLGKGNGEFAAPVASQVGSRGAGVYDVTTTDANADGLLDVVAVHGQKELAVLLGDGQGHFAVAESHTVGSGPQSVLVGDFNGDTVPDIAVAAGGTPAVSVLLHQANP